MILITTYLRLAMFPNDYFLNKKNLQKQIMGSLLCFLWGFDRGFDRSMFPPMFRDEKCFQNEIFRNSEHIRDQRPKKHRKYCRPRFVSPIHMRKTAF